MSTAFLKYLGLSVLWVCCSFAQATESPGATDSALSLSEENLDAILEIPEIEEPPPTIEVPESGTCVYECTVNLFQKDPGTNKYRKSSVLWVQLYGGEDESCQCPRAEKVKAEHQCPTNEPGTRSEVKIRCQTDL